MRTLGRATLIVAGLRALTEGDIKKIVALSTLSQLGVIVIGLGAGSASLAFLHLVAHAFFKALLFLGVGSCIHACARYQDLKIRSNLSHPLPFTSRVLIAAKVRLCGLPFFSGFFRKETILEGIEHLGPSSAAAFSLIIFGILLTQLYTIRFIKKVMIRVSTFSVLHHRSDSDRATNVAMVILIAPAFIGGRILLRAKLGSLGLTCNPRFDKTVVVLRVGLSAYALWCFDSQPRNPSPLKLMGYL